MYKNSSKALRNQCQRRGGSSPFIRTTVSKREVQNPLFYHENNAILMQPNIIFFKIFS